MITGRIGDLRQGVLLGLRFEFGQLSSLCVGEPGRVELGLVDKLVLEEQALLVSGHLGVDFGSRFCHGRG